MGKIWVAEDFNCLEDDVKQVDVQEFQSTYHEGYVDPAFCTIDFDIILDGVDVFDSILGYGVLLKSCGFKEDISHGGDVKYRIFPMVSIEGMESSVGVWFYDKDILKKLTKVCGNVIFDFNEKYLVMKFSLTGILDCVKNSEINAQCFASGNANKNTKEKIISSFFCIKENPVSLTFDVANEISYKIPIGACVAILKRSTKGDFKFELTDSTQKIFSKSMNGEQGIITLTCGDEKGKIIEIEIRNAHLLPPKYGYCGLRQTIEGHFKVFSVSTEKEMAAITFR